ncbi:RNA methyltransferase [Enterococcus faecium]|uniref:DNA methyltransferase n=1 Tax=Enterococcus TaxID=1350 RepID=UPI0008A15205|nr:MULTISPECIES: DNA methyltransferase [Enterococcus]EGP4766633.1 site-specific DNA-methyltransferase [Enterococcus faecium]EGP4864357.1 site-specific DNA-methyltransferase [Enterococcus faecium]EGP5145081.1 RNA methyltransferase [Enterococcus faecium]EGP5247638.1 RNA methyltransferase [Enterococcus faecium]EGP5393373.1 RNA methyltransferase [Enterococcus faecium]
MLTKTEIIDKIDTIDWDFVQSSTSTTKNSIHPYPAKFIEEIPRAVIDLFPMDSSFAIFDPFVGSGTTLVTAQDNGYYSYGSDLNPIACLISRVKTNALEYSFLNDLNEVILDSLDDPAKNITAKVQNKDHWFEMEVQIALQSLINKIYLIDNVLNREALLAALSSIIVKVSNQESDTRYAAIEKNVSQKFVYDNFEKAAKRIFNFMNVDVFKPQTKSEVFNMNSLDISSSMFTKEIGLVITSPPYPNAYEYWLYHKFRMSWLGFDPKEVKAEEIGARAHYFKKNHETINDFFNQMYTLFSKLNSIVIDGGLIVFVIGRSKIHGIEYDNGELLVEVAEKAGLEFICNKKRIIQSSRKSFNLNHANIKEETIMFMRAKR